MAINPIVPIPTPVEKATPVAKPITQPESKSFAETIESMVDTVNVSQQEAAKGAQKMATGDASIDEVMITIERADLQFRMLTQVRNKVVDAYQEVMRMNF